jgi:hypothetical protein
MRSARSTHPAPTGRISRLNLLSDNRDRVVTWFGGCGAAKNHTHVNQKVGEKGCTHTAERSCSIGHARAAGPCSVRAVATHVAASDGTNFRRRYDVSEIWRRVMSCRLRRTTDEPTRGLPYTAGPPTCTGLEMGAFYFIISLYYIDRALLSCRSISLNPRWLQIYKHPIFVTNL